VFSVIACMLFAMPVFAHAGIFSFFASILTGSAETTEIVNDKNSQNVALLQAALNYDPNPSKGGGDITIVGDSALLPDLGPLGTIADIPETQVSGAITIYVVREGDSLSQIAKMFGVSVNTIIWANDIARGNLIQVGETLVILPITGVQYTVQKGDTIAGIAKKFKGDSEDIKQYNDIISDSELVAGKIIVIPDGVLGTPVYSSGSVAAPYRGGGGPTYVGYYIRPVSGARTQGLHGYNGIDLSAPYGTPIVAAASGNAIIVRSYGWNGGYGSYVVIAHPNGTQTLYAHLGSVVLSQGSAVVQGQVIGYAGSTGRSTGPHLHFEVRGAKNPF